MRLAVATKMGPQRGRMQVVAAGDCEGRRRDGNDDKDDEGQRLSDRMRRRPDAA
jgi:hypothetical protein